MQVHCPWLVQLGTRMRVRTAEGWVRAVVMMFETGINEEIPCWLVDFTMHKAYLKLSAVPTFCALKLCFASGRLCTQGRAPRLARTSSHPVMSQP